MSKLAREELSGCSQGCGCKYAEAARQASENFAIAAIAGQVSAARYGLDIVHSHIEDKSDNRTRFLVLGKEHILPSGDDKTSALVSVNNEPGALLRVLSLSKITVSA